MNRPATHLEARRGAPAPAHIPDRRITRSAPVDAGNGPWPDRLLVAAYVALFLALIVEAWTVYVAAYVLLEFLAYGP